MGNIFEVSLWVDVPSSQAAMVTDELEDTLNYAEMVDIIKAEMAKPSKLIEHAAGRIAKALRSRYGDAIAAGELTVAKLAPPIPAQLGSVSFTCNI